MALTETDIAEIKLFLIGAVTSSTINGAFEVGKIARNGQNLQDILPQNPAAWADAIYATTATAFGGGNMAYSGAEYVEMLATPSGPMRELHKQKCIEYGLLGISCHLLAAVSNSQQVMQTAHAKYDALPSGKRRAGTTVAAIAAAGILAAGIKQRASGLKYPDKSLGKRQAFQKSTPMLAIGLVGLATAALFGATVNKSSRPPGTTL